MKAAWEYLANSMELFLEKQLYLDLESVFRSFMELGFHNDWIDIRMGHQYLYLAVKAGCADTVRTLLRKGCRLDIFYTDHVRNSTIAAALENKDLECVGLLLEHCDVNRIMQYFNGDPSTTNFCLFTEAFHNGDELYKQALGLFLKHDADVDARFLYLFDSRTLWNRFCTGNNIPKEWQFSVLEWCFYHNRPLYKQLRPYSKVKPSQTTRAGVLGALELGLHSLQDYLQGVRLIDPDTKDRFLQVILAEQFVFTDECYMTSETLRADPNTALSLLEFGVDPTLSLLNKPHDMFSGVIRHAALAQDDIARGGWMNVIKLLVEKDISPGPDALETAVRSHDINLLRYLTGCIPNIADEGRHALAIAASQSDFEAVTLLLETGVNVNAYVQSGKDQVTILAFAISQYEHPYCGSCSGAIKAASYGMMRYLIRNRAKLIAFSDDWHPCQFLQFLLRETPPNSELARKVQYMVEDFIDFTHPSTPSNGLLEACAWGTSRFSNVANQERLETFEYLLQKGAKVYSGVVIAPLILRESRQQLIQTLIDAGADIHAYSFLNYRFTFQRPVTPLQAAALIGNEQLLRKLLDMGAEVNQNPSPKDAATALQCICQWKAITPEEGLRRLRIIKILLDHGAEVATSPCGRSGRTASQHAAVQGSLDVAIILLHHGANVNDASAREENALDLAALMGRMDMVQCLLNANAVSYRPGRTGYDGAIEWARGGGGTSPSQS
ncbi:hypothetical protein VM1G_10918 [Cytospora mali]|uniref:Uncharacterized protein n=1 Tax=Cytospora mali TaxID=578113 RepID=A0A194VIZ8_CYTMA|nr:hypothetical protein VM1G_10918 [Valsa mali]